MIRLLCRGGVQSHHGKHYTVERAHLYPARAAPGDHGGGIRTEGGEAGRAHWRRVDHNQSEQKGGERIRRRQRVSKPHYRQVTVCWAKDRASAKNTAHEIWPSAAIPGELSQELPQPAHFEQASEAGHGRQVGRVGHMRSGPAKYVQQIKAYTDAGIENVYIHQVGPDQRKASSTSSSARSGR